MTHLRMTSLLSEIADPFCEALADYLSHALAVEIKFTTGMPDPERRQLLDQQTVEIAWICGLLYTVKSQENHWCYTPCAAPCMVSEPRPVYYANLVVHKQNPASSVEDLRGRVWAFNEEGSFSGFQMMRVLLDKIGEPGPFFDRRICSGSHLNSIRMVSNGEVDTAIIDSTVLEMATAKDPASTAQLRTITKVGPFSMPPVVLSPRCPPALAKSIRDTLIVMDQSPTGAALLARWQVAQFLPLDDTTYDDIRQAITQTQYVTL